jgi:hypothetical protein
LYACQEVRRLADPGESEVRSLPIQPSLTDRPWQVGAYQEGGEGTTPYHCEVFISLSTRLLKDTDVYVNFRFFMPYGSGMESTWIETLGPNAALLLGMLKVMFEGETLEQCTLSWLSYQIILFPGIIHLSILS